MRKLNEYGELNDSRLYPQGNEINIRWQYYLVSTSIIIASYIMTFSIWIYKFSKGMDFSQLHVINGMVICFIASVIHRVRRTYFGLKMNPFQLWLLMVCILFFSSLILGGAFPFLGKKVRLLLSDRFFYEFEDVKAISGIIIFNLFNYINLMCSLFLKKLNNT